MEDADYESLSCDEVVQNIVSYSQDKSKDPEEVDGLIDWLLYEYSPEHSFAHHQRQVSVLQSAPLLDLFMKSIVPLYEPEIVLEMLNLLCAVGMIKYPL